MFFPGVYVHLSAILLTLQGRNDDVTLLAFSDSVSFILSIALHVSSVNVAFREL